mgnify:CR=1
MFFDESMLMCLFEGILLIELFIFNYGFMQNVPFCLKSSEGGISGSIRLLMARFKVEAALSAFLMLFWLN